MIRRYSSVAMGLALVVSLVLAVGPTTSRAQEGDGLSEEEQVLLANFFAGIEQRESYTSYAAFQLESQSLVMEITIPMGDDIEEISFTETSQVGTTVEVIRTADGENRRAAYTANYATIEPDFIVAYEMVADAVFVEGELYLNASYNRAEGEFDELPEGWQVFTTADDIPEVFEDLDLGDYFDDNTQLFENINLIEEHATSVTSEPFTRDDGTELELIIITIDGAAFGEFIAATAGVDAAENPAYALFTDESATASIVMQGGLDADGNMIIFDVRMSFSVVEIDAAVLLGDEIPDGTTLTFDLNLTLIGEYSDLNGEFEPIVAPDLEAEATD